MKLSIHLLLATVAGALISNSAAAFTIIQNFDGRADGATCEWDAAGGSTVSSANAFSGTKSCKLSVTAGATAFGTWGGIINHPTKLRKGDQLWFRVRTFMPAGFDYDSHGEGGHLKFMRFHTMSDSTENLGYDDIYINGKGSSVPFKFIFEGEQLWSEFGSLNGVLANPLSGPSTMQINLGTWETYEFYVRFDTVPVSQGGMARVRFWKSGVLMADITNRKTLSRDDAYSDRTHLFTYWNGGAPATEAMYVDDVVLSSDAPAARDAQGNAYIGTSGSAAAAPVVKTPSPPQLSVGQ